ncbi:hypothetical protein NliqN6_3819 [Naganishia liquefaciens]|uniref:ER membrane protein complex subunit 6 n=1 Tax=Naganishia liquefaciens TaxID=104408 RepID=A0A8H3YGP3_9TREE|nr:hypothetical protein NliqN6_3819 [Naganishia liquefaciens]
MDPAAQPNINPAALRIPPTFSPLHPPSVQHNTRILSSLSTLTSAFAGALAGILGLVNWQGFAFYLFASICNALAVVVFKTSRVGGTSVGKSSATVTRRLKRCLPGLNQGNMSGGSREDGLGTLVKGIWQLAGIGQENVMTFLLFWIGLYAIIHVYD